MKLTFTNKLPAAWKALAMMSLTAVSTVPALAAKPIAHDAEFYVLQEQNGERWAQEDTALDARLAELREKNGGKPPNIVYILIDDIGFGDLGSKTLNMIRGYETPSINKVAKEGMRMARKLGMLSYR